MTSRLLVVLEEGPAQLAALGFSPEFRQHYYNPGRRFDELALLDPEAGGQQLPPLSVLPTAAEPAVQAWLNALYGNQDAIIGESQLRAGWPGIPASWLEVARSFGPAVIRAYGARWSGWIGVELAHELGRPCVVSVHNTDSVAAPVVRRADAIMAVSEAVAQACIAAGADPSRVVTVFNRVDRALFSPEGDAAPGPQGAPRLLCIARDVEQKNLDRLLAACESLVPRFPGLRLVHAGKSSRDWSRWPFVTHFDAIAHTEVPRWLRWTDAFVLPSLWEGFGIVFAEALACGVPVVTSNRAPMNEIVTDRWDGLLCDPESVPDIARAIAEIADPGTRARLAAPARTASEPYDIATIEARESALYESLIRPQWPKLSVVLPTFNRRKLIEAAVLNVLSQDYPDLELIVVNDGSSDGTREVLDALQSRLGDPRLRVVHIPNGGLPAALNQGFALAGGEFWTWTSDDNAFKPGALRAMARELMLDPGLGLVFAEYELVREDGGREVVRTGPVSELATRNVVGACFLYRATLARQVGAYKPELKLAEDWDYWRRLAGVARVGRLPRLLYDYGDTPDSLSRTRPAEVIEATLRVSGAPQSWTSDYHQQMVRLAGAYKTQGLAWRSLRTACSIVAHRPGSLSGYKAVVRALIPMPLLRLSRKLRGADAG